MRQQRSHLFQFAMQVDMHDVGIMGAHSLIMQLQ